MSRATRNKHLVAPSTANCVDDLCCFHRSSARPVLSFLILVNIIARPSFAMPAMKLASRALALTLATSVLAQECGTCQSFGVDFYGGGSFFQNSESTDPFTAVQEFEGCSNDTSHNVLVDPNGDQYQCTLTPMQPDDTPETLTW